MAPGLDYVPVGGSGSLKPFRPRLLAREARRGARRAIHTVERRWNTRTRAPEVEQEELNVLFLGSTARSGTSITQVLLGHHPAYSRIPVEAKFIAGRGGLRDLVRDRTTYGAFEKKIAGAWFDRDPGRGLQLIMKRAAIEDALRTLRSGLRSDPFRAGGAFTHALLDPIAAADEKPGWIEKFPANIRVADVLYRMFPNMRLVHIVRDGRDVASSVVRFSWGPNNHDDALDWWARRLEAGFAACDRIPRDRVHVVQVEDLIARDRDHEYQRLLDFLGLADDPSMRAYFDERVTASNLHMGRWRREVPQDRLFEFDAHHERLAQEILRRGRPYRPVVEPMSAQQGQEGPEPALAAAD